MKKRGREEQAPTEKILDVDASMQGTINFNDPVRWTHPSFGLNKNYSWHTAENTFTYDGQPPNKAYHRYYLKSHLSFPGDDPSS